MIGIANHLLDIIEESYSQKFTLKNKWDLYLRQ